MLERRAHPRPRIYLGGTIAFNKRACVLSCVVRNLTPDGAKVTFDQGAVVPNDIDFVVPQRAENWRGRIVWRAPNAAGIAFTDKVAAPDVIPLNVAAKLNQVVDENQRLRKKLEQMRGE